MCTFTEFHLVLQTHKCSVPGLPLARHPELQFISQYPPWIVSLVYTLELSDFSEQQMGVLGGVSQFCYALMKSEWDANPPAQPHQACIGLHSLAT